MSTVLGEEQEMKIDSFNQAVKEAEEKVPENKKLKMRGSKHERAESTERKKSNRKRISQKM